MSEASFSIGGKRYTVSCAEGEEAHVARLGAAVDAKLEELGGNLAPQEAQNLLFAALLIAEDLHQLRNSVTADQGEADRLREELVTARRERDTAAGRHDELKSTIADREAELESLQSSLQSLSREGDDIRSELAQLRSDLETADQVEAELRAGLAGLAEERDALQDELDESRSAQPAPIAGEAAVGRSAASADPELAPALERFAELLEMCADKLEGKPVDT